MIIIGVDYHPEFQQIASVDTVTGELREARLQNPKQAYLMPSWEDEAQRCESEWKPVDMRAGWNDCSRTAVRVWMGDAAKICSPTSAQTKDRPARMRS